MFEFIITVVAHTDNEAVTIAYGIYKRLCTNVTSIEELFKIEHTQEPEKYEVKTETIVQKEIIPEVREEEKEVEFYLIENAKHGDPAFWTEKNMDIVEKFLKAHMN